MIQPNQNCPCRIFTDIRCELGEGLIWDQKLERLLMTDIMQGELIEIDIKFNGYKKWKFDEPLAWALLTSIKGKYLMGFKSGIALFDARRAGAIEWVDRTFPGIEGQRLNDACVDSAGTVWYGSMNIHNPVACDGRLASFSMQDGLNIHDEAFKVTNGPVISPDGQFLFFSDTLEGTIYRYCLNTASATLSKRQVFINFSSEQGYPDGMCFDQEGNLWVALWGGASVAQLDPTGKLLRKIAIPALNATNVCFCGPELDRLMVTTAATGLDEEESNRYPLSGALFEIEDHGSVGIAPYSVTLGSPWN